MKLWQRFLIIFSVSVTTTFFSPSVNAGGDYGSSEPPPEETINEPPIKFDESSKDKNSGEKNPPIENENPAPPPANNPNVIIENKNPELPADNPSVRNEIFHEEENNFGHTIDTGVIGDINNDGELNAIDLVVLQKYLSGDVFEINENAADINGDGNISKFDVFALLNLIKAEKKGTGDVNNDGKVDIYDVQALTEYLAKPSTYINIDNADLTGDGRISTDDLKILKSVISALQQ